VVTRTLRRLDPDRQLAVLTAILDEAAVKGPAAVNIKEVARRAGVSVGALYACFGSRDGMSSFTIELCVSSLTTLLDRYGPSLSAMPVRQTLAAHVAGGIEWGRAVPGLTAFFARGAYQGDPEVLDRLVRPVADAVRGTIGLILGAAVDRGEVRSDVDLAAAGDAGSRRTAEHQQLGLSFKAVNAHVLRLWRMHLGRTMNCCPPLFGRVMVLTHTGRKSGLARRTPVNCRVIRADVRVAAIPGATWLRNIQADPRVEVQLPLGRWRGAAEDVPIDAEHLPQYRAVTTSGGWIAAKLDEFTPRKASDAELLEHGQSFHLLRIRRTERIRRRA